MTLKIKNLINKLYGFYKENHVKVIFVYILHLVISYFVNLPYINIFASLISFLPYLFDWIAIILLFKLQRNLIFKTGIYLFAIGFFFNLFNVKSVLEFLGGSIYLMIGTYVILSLKELKN